MRPAASIVLFYSMILLSVACFMWTALLFSGQQAAHENVPPGSLQQSITTMDSGLSSSSPSWEEDITWIGSVWIPSPRMVLYSTTEMQQMLRHYDSILWLGDKISPFATLYHLLQHDNTTGYLSRRKATDEAAALNSTAACPPWMLPTANITSTPPACHLIDWTNRALHNHIREKEPQRSLQRLEFVTTRCWFHLKEALYDWYSSITAPADQPNQNILVIIALGCDEISHNARRRHACETPGSRQFPNGVWKRLDVVFQQLQDMVTTTAKSSTSVFSSSSTMNGKNHHPRITLVWRLGNYCHAHPDRDGHVQEMDRRIQQGMQSLVQHNSKPQSMWDLLLLNHGQAIQSTAHALSAETRLEHNMVFLQLLANYIQKQQQQQQQEQRIASQVQ